MAEKGYRKVQTKGQITLPKEFRNRHDLGKGDKVFWKQHSRDKSKLIIEVKED
jgi:bifunctional DNA-binding transcriptional regulator/antitoxin component of YhaV-PrlF toxin-antitoxin module